MKSKILISYTAIMLLIVSAIIYSCNDGPSTTSIDSFESLKETGTLNLGDNSEKLNLLLSEAGWFPEGSGVKQLNNGNVRITAPQNWIYIGTDQTNVVHAISGTIDVSCDCTEGSGCDPYIKKSEHCCNMKTDCTKCSKEVKASGIKFGANESIEFTVQKGGYINLEEGVKFETLNKELPMVFSEMLEYSMVTEAIQAFFEDNGLGELLNNQNAPGTEYYHLMLNVFGRRGIVDIPQSMLDDAGSIAVIAISNFIGDDGDYSCSCSEGSCEFKKFMGIKYCESDNCSGTCTLSSSSLAEEETSEAKKAKIYKY